MKISTRILMVITLLALAFLLVWNTPVPAPTELIRDTGRIAAITPDGAGRYLVEFSTTGGARLICGARTGGLPALLHWAERCPYQTLVSAGDETLTIRFQKSVPYEVLGEDGRTLISLTSHRQARTAAVAGAIGLLALSAGVLIAKPTPAAT